MPRDALSSFRPQAVEPEEEPGRDWVAPDLDPPPEPPPFPPEREPEMGGAGPRRAPDLSLIVALLEAARAALPRELEAQFTAFLRELLLALRALIDRYLERLDGGPSKARVEDIPID